MNKSQKYLLLVVLTALVGGGVFVWQEYSKSVQNQGIQPIDQNISLEEVRNADYTNPLLPLYAQQKVTLVDGSYENQIAGTTSGELIQIYGEKIAFGELNNDSKEDAVVVVTGNGGGSGSFRNLSILLNQEGKPVEIDSIPLGDRVIINSITIDAGLVILDMVIHGEGENFKGQCCPNVPAIKKFKLIEDKLTEESNF